MATSAFIEARYGSWSSNYLTPEDRERGETQQSDLWKALMQIVNCDMAEPWTEQVHSPRALPAFLGLASNEPVLIWDAGLGTLFNHLSFPMPYSQPPSVVEGLLRRIVAVRCVLTGRPAHASAQIHLADSLLSKTPVDRTYQKQVDAEGQFEVYLITEMQERFALAHELAHYLNAVDGEVFSRFTEVVVEHICKPHDETDNGILRQVCRDLKHKDNLAIWDAGLDPYAWYLNDRGLDAAAERHWPALGGDIQIARHLLAISTPLEREEIMCDLLGSLSVALAAHNCQAGWTAILSAACSRLALFNLQTLSAIDEWVAGNIRHPGDVARISTPRQQCLNVLLPIMLRKVLNENCQDGSPTVSDVHAVMHLAQDRCQQRIEAGLSRLSWTESSKNTKRWNEEQVLLRAGFIPIRPTGNYQLANRIAHQHKFELGSYEPSSEGGSGGYVRLAV